MEGSESYTPATWKQEGGVKNIKKFINNILVREILQAAAENHAHSFVLFFSICRAYFKKYFYYTGNRKIVLLSVSG